MRNPDSPQRPLWRWLVTLVLVAWCVGAGLAPSQAEPPCLGTEDGRCLPAPAAERAGPRLGARPEAMSPAVPKGPGALVRRRDDVSPARLAAALRARGHANARGLGVGGWWRVSPAPGETMEDLLARLRAMPEVAHAEEDTPVVASYLPNDPRLAEQWALPTIGAQAAWDRSMGHEGVWIAVVDTGVDAGLFPSSSRSPHPDRPADLLWGYDYANDDNDPWDDNDHGTHVAGIAAAATDNARGVAGLCPGCTVLAIKVLAADGRGWNADVADGIAYAAYWGDYYGKRTVINVSLGGGYSKAVADAVAYAQGLGALVVAAAGNGRPIATAPDYPAALPGVLAVTATDANDAPAWFSQYGDIAAPGVSILSTVPLWSVSGSDPPYEFWSGTSMACPMVAGAAGLVWSLDTSLAATAVSNRLLANVDVPAGWNTAFGAGRLNVAEALPPEPTPTLTFTPIPTLTFTATPDPEPSPTFTPVASPTLTTAPDPTPSSTPVPSPSATPQETPTGAPPTVPAPTATEPADDGTPTDTPVETPVTPGKTPVVTIPDTPSEDVYVVTLPLVMVSR